MSIDLRLPDGRRMMIAKDFQAGASSMLGMQSEFDLQSSVPGLEILAIFLFRLYDTLLHDIDGVSVILSLDEYDSMT